MNKNEMATLESQNDNNSQENKKKTRGGPIDRSNRQYSLDAFRSLPRDTQLNFAKQYWHHSNAFEESGLFQFSIALFDKECEALGFSYGAYDPASVGEDAVKEIFITHGRRPETKEKKLTLSVDTLDKFEKLFADSNLSNAEKSKIIDILINQMLSNTLSLKESGRLTVKYKAVQQSRLI